MEIREEIAQLEFCQQNCGLLKNDCRQKNCTKIRRELFQDELANHNSWPCGMADSIISLIVKRIEGIENPYELGSLLHSGFDIAIQKAIKEILRK